MRKRISPENMTNSILLLQPSRPVFCTTKNEDGSDHVAPFSWINPISCNPPRVAFALQNQRGSKLSQSLVNILREREFAACMPHMGQEKELVQASYLLAYHSCKFDRTGYTREDAEKIAPKLIAECSAAIECKVFMTCDHGGDHTLILANVVSATYDEECYDENLWPNTPEVLPLINLKEYRFDDRQEHFFVKTDDVYRVVVPYEKTLK